MINIANQHYHLDTPFPLRLAKKLLWGLDLARGLLERGRSEIPSGLHAHVSDILVTLEPYQRPTPNPKSLPGRGMGPRLPWLLYQMKSMGNDKEGTHGKSDLIGEYCK